MKQLILIFTFLMLSTLGALSKTTLTGNSNTFLKDYQIVQTDENRYELTYSNSSEKFSIEVCPSESECCYLLRNNKIEVMYLCNENGFGLRKMPLDKSQLATSEYCDLVNCKTFMYHSLISSKKKNTKKALGLIACFFPEVINESSRTIVFNPNKSSDDSKLAAQDYSR